MAAVPRVDGVLASRPRSWVLIAVILVIELSSLTPLRQRQSIPVHGLNVAAPPGWHAEAPSRRIQCLLLGRSEKYGILSRGVEMQQAPEPRHELSERNRGDIPRLRSFPWNVDDLVVVIGCRLSQ